jgi:serine/threonine protein phosphatase PrpC
MPPLGQAGTQVCPACGRAAGPEDNFCEACRAELAPAVISTGRPAGTPACPACGGTAASPDGFCESCGRKLPDGRDHVELDLGLVAGVTDRGRRRQRNEDAMALAVTRGEDGPAVLAVVCDGVSTSSHADAASLAAAETTMGVLLAAVRTNGDLATAAGEAVTAARAALTGLPSEAAGGAPSATFVAAVIGRRQVTVCWLGDSRAYWLSASPGAGSQRLTTDDSLAGELMATGLMSEAEAMGLPQAHVVTGWIGADLGQATPHVTTFEPPGPGSVLLCSDGLWNYQPDATALAGLVLPGALTRPLPAAAGLVRFALSAGGRDNVTVVLAPCPSLTPRRMPDEPA